MKRKRFNTATVKKCIELLKSTNKEDQAEGVLKAAYLIEQSFKLEIRSVNPLLYYDTKRIGVETIAKLVASKLSSGELLNLQTVQAKDLVKQICEIKTDLEPHFTNFEALFIARNKLMHSIEDVPNIMDEVEIAVSALRSAAPYIQNCADVQDFNPLTSKAFQKYQEGIRSEHEAKLLERVEKHRRLFEEIRAEEMIENYLAKNRVICDSETWIEETIDCPACGENTFHLVVSVGFDVSDGMVWGGSSSHWYCQTCELELTPYELELVEEKLEEKSGI